jgi:hypothetical protein
MDDAGSGAMAAADDGGWAAPSKPAGNLAKIANENQSHYSRSSAILRMTRIIS